MGSDQMITVALATFLVLAYVCRLGAFHPAPGRMAIGAAHFAGFALVSWVGVDAWQHSPQPEDVAALLAGALWLAASWANRRWDAAPSCDDQSR